FFLQPNVTCVCERRNQLTTGVGEGCGVAVGRAVADAVAWGLMPPVLFGSRLMRFRSEPLASTTASVSKITPAAPSSASRPSVRVCITGGAPRGGGGAGHAGAPNPPRPPRYAPPS